MPIDPSTAFVSYAREDLEFVLRLAKDLKAKGAKVWMDKLDIRPGKRWEAEVEIALNDCARMLVILSPASIASKNVLAEAAYAIDEGKEVIPVLYQDCKMPFRLRPFQYADFRTDYEIGLNELLGGLSGDQPSVGSITPLKEPVAPVTEDKRRLRELERRAQAGDPAAMCRMGNLYEWGKISDEEEEISLNGPPDKLEAMKWYRKSADAGDTVGMYYLACLFDGSSNSAWDSEAVELYRKAAEAGIGAAAYFLAKKYELGNGVIQDLGEARKWYAVSNLDDAGIALKRVESKLAEKRRQEDEEKQKRETEEHQHQRIAAEQARVEEERKQPEAEKARQERFEQERSAAEENSRQEEIKRRYLEAERDLAELRRKQTEAEKDHQEQIEPERKAAEEKAHQEELERQAGPMVPQQLREEGRAHAEGVITIPDLLSKVPRWAKVAAVALSGLLVALAFYWLLRPRWSPQRSGTQETLLSVAFISPQVGWAVGYSGTILHTADGGQSWQAQSSGTQLALLSVAFVSPQEGWAVGSGGTVLHTTDGGKSWKAQSSGTQLALLSVAFVSPQEGWAVCQRGLILHTADGGESWTAQNSGTGFELKSVAMVSPQAGWTVGGNGDILHTADGGKSWQSQHSNSQVLTSVAFVSPQEAWAVGYGGIILHTGDGGENWIAQNSHTDTWLSSVLFATPQVGWAVGDRGTILHTGDGGRSWKPQRSGTQETLLSVAFVSPQEGWAVGEKGTILHFGR